MATAKQLGIKFLKISRALTIIFCFGVAYNITPFLRGPAPYPPEWQWSYEFVNTLDRIWLPIVIAFLGICLFIFIEGKLKAKKHISFFTPFTIALFTLLLQISLLYFNRAGVGVLVERVINPGISGYFTTALSVKSVNYFLATYQIAVAHFPMRAADHPPFAVLFFSLILFFCQKLSFLFPYVTKITLHHKDMAIIWNHLLPFQKLAALFSAILIPVLSASVCIPLYFFTKIFANEKIAVRASFLYSFFPAVSFFLPLSDVFLGLFVSLAFLFLFLGEKKKNLLYIFFSGLSIITGTFFSASIVVPLGMLFLLILLSNQARRIKITTSIVLLLGISILPIFLALFFHFNTISVFIEITKLQAKRSYLPWVFYDLYDFFVFSGIPMLIASFFVIKDVLQTRKISQNILAVSFFSVLFLLDISGFSRAESGRIWMPFMPVLATIVSKFLTKNYKVSSRFFAGLLILQCVQILVMQEFWVTLW